MVLFLNHCSSGPSIKVDKNKDYLEDCRTYFNYKEYEKAIESGTVVIHHSEDQKKQEEALFLVNESAEELVLQIQNDLYIKSTDKIKKLTVELKERYGIHIILEKVGYEYIVYYDKSCYDDLKELNPKSEYINRIELRHIARMSKFVSDPAYRYKQIINVTDKYWQIYNDNPKSAYAASILIKIADLYFYLYEEGINVKKELRLSQSKINNYAKEARTLYKKIKKEYPSSMASRTIAFIRDRVKLRLEPKTKSKILKRIDPGTLVKIIDRSEKKQSISNMYAYWYKVKLISGLEGWIYGFYLRTSY